MDSHTKNNYNPPKNGRAFFWLLLGAIFLVSTVGMWTVDPFQLYLNYEMRVEYGSRIDEALRKEAAGVLVSTYLFNITNAQRFQAGQDRKLKVEEVGPFTYQEMRSHDLLEIDKDADVIRYSPKVRTRFLPVESIGRPEDFNITMPNVAMLAMASKLGTYSMIPQMGFNLLTNRLKSKATVQMTAAEYLWGYEEPLIKFGHTLLPGVFDFSKMGLLDRLYDENARMFLEVSANDADKFAIRTVDRSHGLDMWGYQDEEKRTTCNTFTDTYEGIIYPPELNPQRNIRLYRNSLCRIMELDYHGPKEIHGTHGLQYKISSRTYTMSNETECLCMSNSDICQDGISDLSPCFIGLPLVLSNAHFLDANPSLYERIEGIRPDEERHGSSFVIEPKTGMAMETRFSVQVSLFVRDVSYNSETRPFSDLIIPVVYFTIVQPKLTDQQVHDLWMISVVVPAVLIVLEVISLLLGLVLVAYATILLNSNTRSRIEKVDCVKSQPSLEVPLVR